MSGYRITGGSGGFFTAVPALLCICALSAVCPAQEIAIYPAEKESVQLFEPDLYLGIRAGTYRSAGGQNSQTMIRFYDSTGALHGEALGRLPDYVGQYAFISDGRLMYDYEENEMIIRRTEDFEEVCRFDRYDVSGRVFAGREHVGILSDDGSQLVIYDRQGQVIADIDTDAPEKPAYEERFNDHVRLVIYEPEGYLYVSLMDSDQMLLAALIREDGTILTSDDPFFPGLLCGGQVKGFIGKNLIIGSKDQYSIITPEGEVLLRHAIIHWAYGDYYVMTDAEDKADFAAVREGESLKILDETLAELGRIGEEDLDKYGNLQYADGTIIGLPSEALGGMDSTDVLKYHETDIPAAKIPGGWRVAEELGGFVPYQTDGWEIRSFTDSFILTGKEDQKQRIVRRRDGEVLCETDNLVFLQDNSFLVESSYSDPDSVTTVYDENMNVLYTSDIWIFPCSDDWYYINRGPWAGAADAHGNWILRELQFDE